jgi:hypothetical protein
MTITTANYQLNPQDGWVQVATSASSFLRLSKVPHHLPVWLAFGASAPATVSAAGSGTFTFSGGVPTAGQTVVIGTETYTFRASASLAFEVTIGGSANATATNFAAVVNSTSTLVNASDNLAGVITITAKVPGSAGNYATSSAATHVSAGGAALTGGVDINSGFRWDCSEIFFECAVGVKTWARIAPDQNSFAKISVFND